MHEMVSSIFFQSCDVTHWQSCTRGINQIGQDQQTVMQKSPLKCVVKRQSECASHVLTKPWIKLAKSTFTKVWDITWITWFFEGNFGQWYHARNDLSICPLMKKGKNTRETKRLVLCNFLTLTKQKKKRTT